jgi:hypothetical protein
LGIGVFVKHNRVIVSQMNFVLVILDTYHRSVIVPQTIKSYAVEMDSRAEGMKLRASWQPINEPIDRRRCRTWSRQPNESQKVFEHELPLLWVKKKKYRAADWHENSESKQREMAETSMVLRTGSEQRMGIAGRVRSKLANHDRC